MGAGWNLYGQKAGYTQQQWDALPQSKKNDIKAWMDGERNAANQAIIGGLPGGGWELLGYYPEEQAQSYDDGGYGYGGGGGGAMPARRLNESPEWLAYLNALGLEEAQFRADIDRQRGFLQSEGQRQTEDLKPQYDIQRRGIAANQEARGMTRSGEQLKKLAENRANEGRQVAGIQAQMAGQIGTLESQLAQRLIDINSRKASQELSLRSQGYQ